MKEHLNKYASINQIHHDSLDDDAHVHTHKHSQDGEEHEHHHEHTKISSHEIQFFNSDKCVILVVFENTSQNYFEKESFFSSSYLSSLFRPPIS